MTNWSRDEFAGYGSYSNFPIGLKEADLDINILREGLPGRSLWFAGEHVAPFISMGTVNGAYGMYYASVRQVLFIDLTFDFHSKW